MKLFPSTNTARTPRTYMGRGEEEEEETPDLAELSYRELQQLAGDIDDISGRQPESDLREQLEAHYN